MKSQTPETFVLPPGWRVIGRVGVSRRCTLPVMPPVMPPVALARRPRRELTPRQRQALNAGKADGWFDHDAATGVYTLTAKGRAEFFDDV